MGKSFAVVVVAVFVFSLANSQVSSQVLKPIGRSPGTPKQPDQNQNGSDQNSEPVGPGQLSSSFARSISVYDPSTGTYRKVKVGPNGAILPSNDPAPKQGPLNARKAAPLNSIPVQELDSGTAYQFGFSPDGRSFYLYDQNTGKYRTYLFTTTAPAARR